MNTDEKTKDQIRIETKRIQSFKVDTDERPYGLIEMHGVSVTDTEYDAVFIGRGQSPLLAAEAALENFAQSIAVDDSWALEQIQAEIEGLDDMEDGCGAATDQHWRDFQKANGCPSVMVDQGKFVCPAGTTPNEFGLKFKAYLETAKPIELSAAILIRFGYPDTRETALARHLDIAADDVTEVGYGENTYDADGSEYLVMTDDEADAKAEEYILDTVWAFQGHFLADYLPGDLTADDVDAMRGDRCEDANDMFTALVKAGRGLDALVSDAIGADGRGHFVAQYDGEETEILGPDGETFYIYRTN